MLLTDMRRRIDEIDSELLRLLNKRASIVSEIAIHKKACHLPLQDLQRRVHVIQQAVRHNSGPLSDEQVGVFFEEMLEFFEDFESSTQTSTCNVS